MRALQLTRTPEDHKLYDLRGVGTLRVGRWPSRKVEAETGARAYTFDKRRLVVTATDRSTGEQVAEIRLRPLWKEEQRVLFRWRTIEWELRPSLIWPTGFALTRPGDEREVVTVAALGWSKRPVPVAVDDATATDAGLVLFALFAIRVVADEMIAAAAGSVGGSAGG